MNEQLLKMNGLSLDILDALSFESHLGIPLKKNLHYFDKTLLIQELFEMTEWLDAQELLSEIAIDYRVKSMDSIRDQWGIVYPFEKDEVEAKIPEKSEEIVTEQLPAEKEETVAETVETDAENAGETEQVESTEVLKESVEAVLSESATTEAAETEN